MPITITIVDAIRVPRFEDGPETRQATIQITDGTLTFYLTVGGLPLNGVLQDILNADATRLWVVALEKGTSDSVYRDAAKSLLDKVQDPQQILNRGLSLTLFEYVRSLAVKHNSLITYLQAQVGLTNRAVLASMVHPTPTWADTRVGIKNRITNKEADL